MAGKVRAIPEGYHSITPHIIVRDAAKAIDFYKKAFGAEEIMRMPGPGGKIMHAELKIGNSHLMMCEESQDWGCLSPQALNGSPITIHLYVENVDTAFDRAVKAGAKAEMPVSDMFWGDRYGKLKDPFGHNWSLATHKEDVPPQECAKRAEQWMSQQKCG
jgi:uncharacterized glyoxalase superfamily protein PhnB